MKRIGNKKKRKKKRKKEQLKKKKMNEEYKMKDGEFYQSAKRNKCTGCNVKVNWTLDDSYEDKLKLKEH